MLHVYCDMLLSSGQVYSANSSERRTTWHVARVTSDCGNNTFGIASVSLLWELHRLPVRRRITFMMVDILLVVLQRSATLTAETFIELTTSVTRFVWQRPIMSAMVRNKTSSCISAMNLIPRFVDISQIQQHIQVPDLSSNRVAVTVASHDA